MGSSVELPGYTFRFQGVDQIPGPNYRADRGTVEVLQGDHQIATLRPEKRTYLVQTNPMTEAAIDVGVLRDIYVSLGEPLGGGAWSLRVYYKPLIRWIWAGALLMALGGLIAAADRRYRVSSKAMARASRPASGTGVLTTQES